jgi:hypothetical protein
MGWDLCPSFRAQSMGKLHKAPVGNFGPRVLRRRMATEVQPWKPQPFERRKTWESCLC